MIKKIDHIGIAVRSIEAARRFYEEILELPCDRVEEVPSQKVRIAFFKAGEVSIELLEPTAADSPIAKFIETKGEGIHHIAYEVDRIQEQLDQSRERGCRLINETPILGARGKQVAFLHPKSSFGVLTELTEKGEKC